ncbi:MAG: SDR family oxidoreductase [Acidimicrobiales bacterium]|jgi:NAD(P)-dependent dehydrogenase (short-subunit alcohol dehydrogenase family)|nr:SDR family oxidoreductase [Acidimicrobiales bacterium]
MTKTVVVTGANRGLGLELVRNYITEGADVWGACRRPAEATDLEALHPAGILELDISSEISTKRFGAHLGDSAERIDLLINNAGVSGPEIGILRKQSSWQMVSVDNTLEMIRTNGLGAMLVTRAVLPLLDVAERPKVVNITSQLGSMKVGREFTNFPYAVSKAVMNMFTAQAAHQLSSLGVMVVCFHPGWVQTRMGGKDADLSPEESARGIVETIESLNNSDSGKFFRWDGTEHPW